MKRLMATTIVRDDVELTRVKWLRPFLRHDGRARGVGEPEARVTAT